MILDDQGVIDWCDTIFAAIFAGGKKGGTDEEFLIKKLRNVPFFIGKFKSTFPVQVFLNEYALFYEMVVKQNTTVFSIPSLRTIIENNWDVISDSPYIDLKRFKFGIQGGSTTRDEQIQALTEEVTDKFIELANVYVENIQFENACRNYIQWFRNEYMIDTTQALALVMTADGYAYKEPGKVTRIYKGEAGVNELFNKRNAVLKALDSERAIVHKVYGESEYVKDTEKKVVEGILDYGIDELDEIKGMMRRGNMVEILGPPKGGKTTFVTFEVARALAKGLNVVVWALEGTEDEWKSLLIALMVRMDPASGGRSIDKKDVINKTYQSEADKQFAESARATLACGQGRGRLSFIDGTAYIEDYLEELKYHYDNVNPFDIVVMDSPINIMSRRGGDNKVTRISECYMTLKNYISKQMKVPALCLCTAQIKQSVVDYIRSHPDEELDVTSGGESAETIRTPDEIIGIFGTKAERMAGRTKLHCVASRHNRDARAFYIHAEFGCGYFESNPGLNE